MAYCQEPKDGWYYIKHWQQDYCIGHPMPEWFRTEASSYFLKFFESSTNNLQHLKYTEKPIYRIIRAANFKTLRYDSLYYSFSKDIDGTYNFSRFNKYLKGGKFLLLKCTPDSALDYEELSRVAFIDYKENEYSKEHEIVSKFNKAAIIEIYFIDKVEDLNDYENKGIKIKNNLFLRHRVKRLYKKACKAQSKDWLQDCRPTF